MPARAPAPAGQGEWLARAGRDGAGVWLDNARGAVHTLEDDGHSLSLVLADDDPGTSYVASLISAWPRYGCDEARRHLPLPARPAASLALGPLAALMRAGRLHRAAFVGNELVSTNLLPDLSADAWRRVRDAAIALAPARPLVLRNVCEAIRSGLPARLERAGWLLVPARTVYLCDPADPAVRRRNNNKNDARLLKREDVRFVSPEAIVPADLPALRALFRQLFMERHSALNPDFSDAFFELCRTRRYLELHGLRHDGRWVGVVGFLHRHGWLTTPLLGYDLSAPRELGLYRRLMAHGQRAALACGARLHLSAGAGEFKRSRGGEPVLEFTALYVAHLPRGPRAAATAFAATLARLAPPVLRRFG
ncbi:GNAT family N-acetyltransferase [Nitrogeniibacter mangrovi]|uniref:GNAT family N-acetyltransferase n=1 Tax=Nitrogeniibacter mangrovi TaxID=2016596 RepID=A0A6C1B137_9RHOO|nr:GNAT family N-acetyltransferase [Nitrogeniibacter mangrovi]QID17312.1 GNAT family N-acetyltransferase [Nitrogeniibacter mangrovi]